MLLWCQMSWSCTKCYQNSCWESKARKDFVFFGNRRFHTSSLKDLIFSCTPQNEKMNHGSEFSLLEYKTIMKLKYKPWWNTDMPCIIEGYVYSYVQRKPLKFYNFFDRRSKPRKDDVVSWASHAEDSHRNEFSSLIYRSIMR